ncbi:MAG TPA: ATP-binding cassette domain-containing protein, partial [Corynebacterium sp.]|nr:ATP-binding cassette domain-containing protein [Corynebacterium sp.]
LKLAKLPNAEIEAKVREAAELLGLEEFLDRKPKDLSGGQRQRVAMGRAIVRDPKVFLMDEPLSNLDAKLRVQTRAELAALQRRLGTTTVYVTHDQVEAMTMGDRVAVLRDGVLQQVAPPRELYDAPVNEFVAGFIGSPAMNLFPGEGVTLGVRPEAMRLVEAHADAPAGWVVRKGTVTIIEELGSESYVYAECDADRLVARITHDDAPAPGERVELAYDPANAHRFDPTSGLRL